MAACALQWLVCLLLDVLLPIRELFHDDTGLSPKRPCLGLISNIPGFIKLSWNAFPSCVECIDDLSSSSKIIFIYLYMCIYLFI